MKIHLALIICKKWPPKGNGFQQQLKCALYESCLQLIMCLETKDVQNHRKYYTFGISLRKHAYSNVLKILPLKNENFQIKSSLIFFIFLLKNIDCGYSLEPPR